MARARVGDAEIEVMGATFGPDYYRGPAESAVLRTPKTLYKEALEMVASFLASIVPGIHPMPIVEWVIELEIASEGDGGGAIGRRLMGDLAVTIEVSEVRGIIVTVKPWWGTQ